MIRIDPETRQQIRQHLDSLGVASPRLEAFLDNNIDVLLPKSLLVSLLLRYAQMTEKYRVSDATPHARLMLILAEALASDIPAQKTTIVRETRYVGGLS